MPAAATQPMPQTEPVTRYTHRWACTWDAVTRGAVRVGTVEVLADDREAARHVAAARLAVRVHEVLVRYVSSVTTVNGRWGHLRA